MYPVPMLQVDHVSRNYNVAGSPEKFCVFENVSLKVDEGEFVTVVGHSGCGKSTLLNIIAGIDKSDTGCVLLRGKAVQGPGIDRMVVFQNFALMPWLTVYQNVRLSVEAAFPDWTEKQLDGHTRRYLEMVSLKGAENKRPAALSGGMRQRCGLARAFAANPPVMLLDEPFAQIDALTRGVIQDELIRMWNETRVTIFMVTHDVDEAILLSDRIILMSPGPGAVIAGTVDIPIERPRSRQSIIEDRRYYALRNDIIRFLENRQVEKTA
ncbi:MAG: ABC transporter ATP-binding protein [Desulfovibrio sp.]|jgi:nitrate/nitrite transport system ATP-binding protein|nr:ABC transporter ATP-binding protein [Desulfovibrio sp.]